MQANIGHRVYDTSKATLLGVQFAHDVNQLWTFYAAGPGALPPDYFVVLTSDDHELEIVTLYPDQLALLLYDDIEKLS